MCMVKLQTSVYVLVFVSTTKLLVKKETRVYSCKGRTKVLLQTCAFEEAWVVCVFIDILIVKLFTEYENFQIIVTLNS